MTSEVEFRDAKLKTKDQSPVQPDSIALRRSPLILRAAL